MASSFSGFFENAGIWAPAAEAQRANYSEIYNRHCHRIYTLAFLMTDNELVAEQVSADTFLRAFARNDSPATEQIDQAFLAEIREMMPVGTLTLNANETSASTNIRGNMNRIHLERAVVELPATERMIFLLHDVEGYEHEKIARLLGISPDESKMGLHQARVQVRESVASMS
jgi:RNA polymerase sigma-70 factor, ECF subfamily